MLDIANMAKTGEASAMYDALMAVKPEGMSLNQWAGRAGVHRSIFNGIRAHGNPTRTTLEKLLAAIGVSLTQFEARLLPVRSEVRSAGLVSERDVEHARHGARNFVPVPLVGSAVGGTIEDLDEHVEMTELHLSEVLDYLARPAILESDPGAYAVTIVGESMAPRFEPGERAFVSPRASVGIGDDVIVQLRAAPNGDPDHDQRVTMVLIKRLVKRGPDFLELKQFNPSMTFRLPLGRVAAIHRVVGRL
jgi:phage repressor protein C with HTH and peptisase S24 domain